MVSYVYVELDLFVVALFVIMAVNRGRGESQALEQKLFNLVLFSNALILLLDAGQWLLDGLMFPGAHFLCAFVAYLYYAMNAVVPFTWLIYCDCKIHGSLLELRRRIVFYLIPFTASIAFVVSNLWTQRVFFIDATNTYHRGADFVYVGAVMFSQAIWAAILNTRHMLRATTDTERKEFRFLSLFMVFPTFGYLIQTMIYGLQLIWICSALSLFLIYIKVQNRLIFTDELTRVNNRRQISREFLRRIESIGDSRCLYAIMIDADNFKKINDTFGHAAGDAMLLRAAQILEGVCARHRDFLARMGGDEFLIFATRPMGEGLGLIEEVELAIRQFNGSLDAGSELSLSCGAAMYGSDGIDTLDQLLSAADQAMFEEKSERKTVRRQTAS